MACLSGKTALVTGASRGIGARTAQRLGEAGALVAVHYGKSRDKADAVVRSIRDAGGNAFAIGADLVRVEDIEDMFHELDDELASRTASTGLDILVANAGIGGGGSSFAEATRESFDTLFDTNVRGMFFTCQHAIPRLRENGRVVCIGSLAARDAAPERVVYSASKHFVKNLVPSLAKELAPRRITVNAIAPGAVDTDLIAGLKENPKMIEMIVRTTPFGRLGTPDDIAGAIMMLLGPDAAWVTGQVIEATGGARL